MEANVKKKKLQTLTAKIIFFNFTQNHMVSTLKIIIFERFLAYMEIRIIEAHIKGNEDQLGLV